MLGNNPELEVHCVRALYSPSLRVFTDIYIHVLLQYCTQRQRLSKSCKLKSKVSYLLRISPSCNLKYPSASIKVSMYGTSTLSVIFAKDCSCQQQLHVKNEHYFQPSHRFAETFLGSRSLSNTVMACVRSMHETWRTI